MDKKIIFIDNGPSFMTNAILMNLKKELYEVTELQASMKELTPLREEKRKILLLYLGDYIEERSDVLVFLKDVCMENEHILFVVGDDRELEMLYNAVPKKLPREIFPRPLDMKKLVESLERFMELNSEMAMRKQILLVDDDPTFLKMMYGWLSSDYRVTMVNSGMQAIQFLANNTPDLILLDYEMPVTDGPQVFQMIRSEARTATTPVIFLTGRDDKESVMKVLALKPEGYLLKTMEKQGILSALSEFFESRKGL